MILRHYAAYLNVETTHADPLVRKIASYLRCFMPLLVLLGVSSAQINASANDVIDMGAHENAMLIPKGAFYRLWLRTDPAATRWRDALFTSRPEERGYWERSAAMQTLVLEGSFLIDYNVIVVVKSSGTRRDWRAGANQQCRTASRTARGARTPHGQ